MLIIPKNILGVYTGFSYSIKNNSQKGKIISIPCNSILNNYELKNLNICNSSPILHPRLNISGLFTWKQRSFVLIKKFILILDYLVPTTRICIFKKNLTSILEHGNELLIFSVYERKIVIIEHLKLRIVHSIILPFGFINIISVDNSLKNFLLILKDNTSIIVFDIRKRSSIKIVNFRKKIEISCLKGSSSLRNIFIGTISDRNCVPAQPIPEKGLRPTSMLRALAAVRGGLVREVEHRSFILGQQPRSLRLRQCSQRRSGGCHVAKIQRCK